MEGWRTGEQTSMAFYTHRVPVRTSIETLWALLVDKIRHPDRYIDGVEQVEILHESGPLAVERRMSAHTLDAYRRDLLALLRATGILCVYGSGFGMPAGRSQ